ncbi:MAG: zinc-dependent metalloprotease [Rubricoccaceae bacterium]
MRVFAFLILASSLAACSTTQPTAAPPSSATPADSSAADSSKAEEPKYKPFAEVVTDTTESDDGLFNVHRVEEKLYFEIPDSLLGRDMLSLSRIAQTPADLSPFINAGSKTAERVIRWERNGDRILLRTLSYSAVADTALAISQSVRVNNFEPVIAAFDIASLSEDSAGVVIDVTDLYTTDVPAFSGMSQRLRTQYKVRRLDGKRSFIDGASAFPENVNVRHTMTYEATEPPSQTSTGTMSMQMFQSFILLPEEPMMARLADPRVGFFSVRQIDYGSDEQKADEREYIRRWRLVPSDPAAYMRGELVEPVKPIVYILDPGTPEHWRPYFCKGVEDWNRAFEAAGFKDAVRCEMPPAPGDSTQFDPEDVRYSTVRYVASETRNATGPSVSDPRSGEIIESDIIWYHNHIRSYRNRLMIETGAANPQARSLIIDEELIGETMRQVIAHEIGHALGLPHNMIASSSFPVDSLRSPTFTSEYGVAPTIMDYTRQNYIAQPGDGVTRFVRMVGPYDDYVIEWGYRWFPDVMSPEDEKARLDALVLAKADDPMYRFRSSDGVNPDAQTEDMGDDPVLASSYAVANLKRVVPNLIDWTSTPGRGYDDLEEIYGELVGMWSRYMGHVVTVVGGVRVTPKTSDQAGPLWDVVPPEEQRAAMAFLTENVFQTPDWLLDTEILRRIESAGAVDALRRRQVSILNRLLDPERMQRLVEAEAIDGVEGAYTLTDFMNDATRGVWIELETERPVIDAHRRALQRGHIERLEMLLTDDERPLPPGFPGSRTDYSQSDIRAMARAQLKVLRNAARGLTPRAGDNATVQHLDDIADRIDAVLDPRREG